MSTGNPSKLSINAFLQIFATKMPYLPIFRDKNAVFTNFRDKNAVFTNFCDKNAVFTNFRAKNAVFTNVSAIFLYLYLFVFNFWLIVYISKVQLSVSKLVILQAHLRTLSGLVLSVLSIENLFYRYTLDNLFYQSKENLSIDTKYFLSIENLVYR